MGDGAEVEWERVMGVAKRQQAVFLNLDVMLKFLIWGEHKAD